MRTGTTIALAVVALVLGAFIFFYERHTIGTSELARREGRLLEVFARARVSRVEIEYAGRSLELVREPGDENEEGRFRIARPIEAHADDDAVEALLGALDWAVPFRVIDDVSPEDRAMFGLDAPFASVRIFVGEKLSSLVIGKEAPGGEGRYAAGLRPDRVYVVSADVVEALSHDVDHFRSKRLFPESFVRVSRVERGGEGGAFVLADRDGVLRLVSPAEMTANGNRVEALLRAMQELSATKFLDGEALEASLLASARLFLRVDADGEAHGLEVFGSCPDTPGKALARVTEGATVCVDESALEPLTIEQAAFREMRLASARDFDVEHLTLRQGDRRIEISLREDPRYELFERDAKVAEGEADEAAFTDWLRTMRRSMASEARPLPEKDRARYGLDRPRGELRVVERGPLKRTTVLHFGRATVASLPARREDDEFVLEFSQEAADLVWPAAFRVRKRQILDAELHQVIAIHVTAQDKPRVEVDPAKHSELAARLAELEAVRYEADTVEARHGLESPRAQIEVEVAADHDHGHSHGAEHDSHTKHRLRLGTDAEDGVYAALDDDPMVFVVARELYEAALRAL
jgi:hypothetical protein